MDWESLDKISIIIGIVSFVIGFGAAKVHTRISLKNSGSINSNNTVTQTITGNNNTQSR